MVDVNRTLELEDFRRWNRVCHTRKIQDRYQELVKEAQRRKVDVKDIMIEHRFENWAAFADSCDKFSLRCRLKDFSELGSGWVLYFYFLRFMMAVMLVFVIAHIPILAIYASHDRLGEWSDPAAYAPQVYGGQPPPDAQGQEPQGPQGPQGPVALTWMARLSPGSLGVEGASPALVPLCYTVANWLLMVMIAFMYALVHKIDEEVDLETTHPNDFAVLVEGLPPTAKEDTVIKEFFQENAVPGRRVEVVKVVIGWNVAQFEQTAKQLKKLRDKRRSQRMDGTVLPPDQEASLAKEIEALENRLDLSKGGAAELKSAGIAIVVFRMQADQVACLRHWDGFMQRWFYKTPSSGAWCSLLSDAQPLPKFQVGGRPLYQLRVSRAPNPTDINWRDAGRTTTEFVLRKAATIVALTIILIVSYIMVFVLSRVSRQAVKPPPGISREYIVSLTVTSLLPATAITIINVLLMLVARWFGEREVHLTKTGEAAAITWYMTVAMVINGAVVLWNISWVPPDWFKASGLVSDMYAMLAINFIFPPLMFLMDYELAMNWFFRRRLTPQKLQELNLELDKYRGKEDPTDRDMFRYVEEKVRSWEVCFEPTIMDLPRHYANVEKTYYCCLIYMPLLPLAPLVGLVSILFQYINDKWMLLRYCRRPSIVQNAEAALEGMMRMRYVLPWLLPIMMIIFLRPCYGQQGPINIAVAGSLLPGIAFMLVPTRHLAVCFRWAMPSWLQSESHRRGSVVDETTQDYYQAQHLWPKERKYHKTHFLYMDLPEDINPEHLTPETRDVQIGVIMGELLHLRSKPSRSRRRREDSRDAVPHGLRGGRSGASSASGRSGKSYATGKATDGRVVPEIIGVSEGVLPATGRWEFEAGSGFKPFDEDCQAEVEQLYQQFKNGGHHRAEVQTKGKRISLDFKLMTSMVVGSRTVRQIRRQ